MYRYKIHERHTNGARIHKRRAITRTAPEYTNGAQIHEQHTVMVPDSNYPSMAGWLSFLMRPDDYSRTESSRWWNVLTCRRMRCCHMLLYFWLVETSAGGTGGGLVYTARPLM